MAQILFLHPSDDGYGIDRVALETVQAMRAAGHGVHCVIEAANPGNGWLSERLSQAQVDWEKAQLGFLSRAQMRSLPAAARWLTHQAAVVRHLGTRIRNADLVYVNGFTLVGVAVAARLRRRRVLLHLHEIPPASHVVGRAVRAASSSQVCVSAAVAEALGLSSSRRCTVVHNGVVLPAETVVQTEAGPEQPCPIGIVARINRWKGHLVLGEAFRLLVSSGVPAQLHIVGAAHPTDTATATELDHALAGLDDAVVRAGEVADGAAYMANLQLLVAPSLEPDPFPVTVLEGMARGLAVVATDIGGHPEAIVDGESGVLVPAGDTAALADVLQSLVDDVALRARLGAAARQRCADLFSAAQYRAAITASVERALQRS